MTWKMSIVEVQAGVMSITEYKAVKKYHLYLSITTPITQKGYWLWLLLNERVGREDADGEYYGPLGPYKLKIRKEAEVQKRSHVLTDISQLLWGQEVRMCDAAQVTWAALGMRRSYVLALWKLPQAWVLRAKACQWNLLLFLHAWR